MIRVRRESPEGGFTLVELLTAMLLFGIIVAIAVGPYRNYQRAQGQLAATRKLVAVLRNAQVRSVAEDSSYRVRIATDGKSYHLERLVGSTWTAQATYQTSDATSVLTSASFRQSDGSTSSTCYFYPRGAATKGSVQVTRSGSSKVYTVNVEGLTARVSYS